MARKHRTLLADHGAGDRDVGGKVWQRQVILGQFECEGVYSFVCKEVDIALDVAVGAGVDVGGGDIQAAQQDETALVDVGVVQDGLEYGGVRLEPV